MLSPKSRRTHETVIFTINIFRINYALRVYRKGEQLVLSQGFNARTHALLPER
jgi:hypothetical protein